MDALLPWLRRTGWAYVAVAVALALVSWRMVAGGDASQGDGAGPVTVATVDAAPAATAGEGPGRARVVVHVTGQVRRPGVYALAEGARVQRAVASAGGPTRRADMTVLNLAATVQDGQQIVVPARVAPGAPAASGASAGAGQATGPISLSQATAEQLETLDGIGPTLAGRIVAHRDANGGFASVDQLLEVQGIGPARLEALRAHVVP